MKKDQAIVYCEGAFNTPNGKTAHGLVRFTKSIMYLLLLTPLMPVRMPARYWMIAGMRFHL